jgi:hypothetical protein
MRALHPPAQARCATSLPRRGCQRNARSSCKTTCEANGRSRRRALTVIALVATVPVRAVSVRRNLLASPSHRRRRAACFVLIWRSCFIAFLRRSSRRVASSGVSATTTTQPNMKARGTRLCSGAGVLRAEAADGPAAAHATTTPMQPVRAAPVERRLRRRRRRRMRS